MDKKVVVVGAGIFGVAAALELHQRGYKVVVINDSGSNPYHSSASYDISKVVRSEYGSNRMYFEMGLESIKGWKEWNKKWEEEVYHNIGLLVLSKDKPQPGSFVYDSREMLQEEGLHVEDIGLEPHNLRLQERYPVWNHSIYRYGFFNSNAGWVESGLALTHLINDALNLGITFIQGTVTSLIPSATNPKHIQGLITQDQHQHFSDYILLATGAWTTSIQGMSHLSSFLTPTGQLVFHFQPPPSLLFALSSDKFPVYMADISQTGFYGFPIHHRQSNRMKIANHGPGWHFKSEKLKGDNGYPESEELQRKMNEICEKEEERFRKFMKGAFNFEEEGCRMVHSRMCFYTDTPDGDFLMDFDPKYENVFVATGGSGHGLKFGPVLGRIISDLFEGDLQAKEKYKSFRWRIGEPVAAGKKEGSRYTEKVQKSAL
eukprot:TRINITY_DN5400_c0_g1_i1.p1 TRINITY_DN5400_c0_g1~~TRINITY_DN5400_c0_g1_i1.p1  ORF type:complete len:431 (-),score=58.51 TRINITY_DN5400_c0_g1_i1:61-1353(-)